jgi:hypothetical protein
MTICYAVGKEETGEITVPIKVNVALDRYDQVYSKIQPS